MTTTRRLSGMPQSQQQQGHQQFGLMLETYEAFRKKHVSQNKEIISKNSELHKTNATLQQELSLARASNLALKGNLLQYETELVSLKDRLYRAQEREHELVDELARVKRDRNGHDVPSEHVDEMRHALATAMAALQAFEHVLPHPSVARPSPAASPYRATLPLPEPIRAEPATTTKATTQSRRQSLAEQQDSSSSTNPRRMSMVVAPELSFIEEGDDDQADDEVNEADAEGTTRDGGRMISSSPSPYHTLSPIERDPLPLPLPISTASEPSTEKSTSRSSTSTRSNRRLSGLVRAPLPTSSSLEVESASASTSTRLRDDTIVEEEEEEEEDAKERVDRTGQDCHQVDEDEGPVQGEPERKRRKRRESVLDLDGALDLDAPRPSTEPAHGGEPRSGRTSRRASAVVGPVGTVDERSAGTKTTRTRTSTVDERSANATTASVGSALLQAKKDSLRASRSATSPAPPSPLSESRAGDIEMEAPVRAEEGAEDQVDQSHRTTSDSGGDPAESIEEQDARPQPCPRADDRSRPQRTAGDEAATTADATAEGTGARRARKSVNYALPKLNTKMRRPEDYVPVTHSAASHSSKPRKSAKPAVSQAPLSTAPISSSSTSSSTSSNSRQGGGGTGPRSSQSSVVETTGPPSASTSSTAPLTTSRPSLAGKATTSASTTVIVGGVGPSTMPVVTRQPSLAGKKPAPLANGPCGGGSTSSTSSTLSSTIASRAPNGTASSRTTSTSSTAGATGSRGRGASRVTGGFYHDPSSSDDDDDEYKADVARRTKRGTRRADLGHSQGDDDDDDDDWDEERFLQRVKKAQSRSSTASTDAVGARASVAERRRHSVAV